MKVIKEILINDKKWHLDFSSFSDRFGTYGNAKFQLVLYCLEDKSKSIQIFNNWGRIYVYKDGFIIPFVYDTILEARIGVLKYFLNEL
jgi:hypothetical protein